MWPWKKYWSGTFFSDFIHSYSCPRQLCMLQKIKKFNSLKFWVVTKIILSSLGRNINFSTLLSILFDPIQCENVITLVVHNKNALVYIILPLMKMKCAKCTGESGCKYANSKYFSQDCRVQSTSYLKRVILLEWGE